MATANPHPLLRRGALPALAAVILAAPCLGYSFLYDDFDFLSAARSLRPGMLLPDPRSLFYRPLSREVWFAALSLLHLDRPWVFHALNALLLALAVIGLTSLAHRLLGRRASLIAGFTLAGLGSIPILTGWAAGAQDLLAVDLVLAAMLLRLAGRNALAVLAATAAILCKETAVAVIPVLVTLGWLLERRRILWKSDVLPYAILLLSWILIHPGVHILLRRRFESGAGGYLGLDQPDRTAAIVRSVLTLANVPVANVAIRAIGLRWIAWALGCALAWIGLSRVGEGAAEDRDPGPVPTGRVLVLAALLALSPLILTVALVRQWAPYYACMPALGTSLAAAVLLRDRGAGAVSAFLIGFMT